MALRQTAAILLLLVGISCKRPVPKASEADLGKTTSDTQSKPAELNGWRTSTETDKMENTTNVYLSKFAESSRGGMLTIRCVRRKTELLVATDDILDSGNVRIKFDDEKPQRQVWNESSNHTALFSPAPIALARQLTKADSFLVEYSPFQARPITLEFKVNGLVEKLSAVAEACEWARIDRDEATARAFAKAKAERAKADAEAEAELARRRDTALREVLLKRVGACHEKWLQDLGRWCWYDESSSGYKGGMPFESKEAALDDVMTRAKSGQVFRCEMEEIERELR